jgi:hypothetical protein
VVQSAAKLLIEPIFEADLEPSAYFDTIPHDSLIQLVARRIVDRNILHLDQDVVEGSGGRTRREWEATNDGRTNEPLRDSPRRNCYSSNAKDNFNFDHVLRYR